MAGLEQIHSFVGKFVSLWQLGLDANLHLNTKAGEAHVNLIVGLGQAPLPPHQAPNLPRAFRPSRMRRRERRAAVRSAPEEEAAEQAADREEAAEEATNREETAAEKAAQKEPSGEDGTQQPAEDENDENLTEITAAEAASDSSEYSCDLCDNKFRSVRGLRTHEGKMHKETIGSRIPQLDGECETLEEFVTYTFVSEYAAEDIIYTLEEIFPADVETKLVSQVRTKDPRSADHFCTLQIKLPAPQHFSWPKMNRTQEEVIKDLTKI